jgi:predicted enzyme related to lactoylglutathione lyase
MGDSVRGQILWYELMTTDMKAAEAFYSKVVGWTVTTFEGTPQPYDMFMRTAEAPAAGVMTIPEGMEFPPHWGMYVGVDTIEDAIAHVERLGGKALGPLIDVPTIGRMQTMMDPQSAAFSIYESATPQPADAEPQVGQASWHELMTTDAEAAMKFYAELFGWKPTETMDMGPMGKYHMFGRTFPLGGMMNKPAELAHVPPHWGIYFRVAEINAAADRVKSNGGQVLNGPMEVPGGDFVVNCMDPQGAAFSLHAKP